MAPVGALRSEWRRRLVPALSVLAASMAMGLPLPLSWSVMPNVAMLLVITWASVQPRLLPVWAGFLLGLSHDVLVGAPPGLHGLLFALAVVAVRVGEGRLESRTLGVDWAIVAVLVLLLYGLMGLLLPVAGASTAWPPLLLQAVLTALCFPPVLAFAALLHRRLIGSGGY